MNAEINVLHSIKHNKMFNICINFALATLAIFLYNCYKKKLNYWKNKNVRGPKPIPFFGNLRESAFRQKHVAEIYKDIYDAYPSEKVIGIHRMTSPSILIRDLDLVKQILIKDFVVFTDRGIEFSKEGLGENLFHSNITTWKILRSRLSPLFASRNLKRMIPLLCDRGDKLVAHIESFCHKQPEQEVNNLIRKYAIATILASLFSLDVDMFTDNTEIFEKMDRSIFKTSYVSEIDMLCNGVLVESNTSIFDGKVIRFCYRLVQSIVHHKHGKPNENNDLFDVLLKLKSEKESQHNDKNGSFNIDHVMAGQVLIFYAAGYSNTEIVLSFSLYELAKHPDVQYKVVSEIDEVLQKYNGELTYDALHEMMYLDKVFDETLRMHPTVRSIERAAAQDYKIPGTDVTINRGISVVISPMAVHYDETIYPNPDKYDPDRFAPENLKNRHSCAYLPFGTGPRMCIGIRFAKLQFKVCVVKLLSKFRVEPSNRTKDTCKFDPMRTLLCAKGGIYLNFVPRFATKSQ